MSMQETITPHTSLEWRTAEGNQWLTMPGGATSQLQPYHLEPEVLPTEDAVGEAMLQELCDLARVKPGNLVVVFLGGRGGQALHRKLAALAASPACEEWIPRLHVFMQDALAPMAPTSTLSFLYDFRRLLGEPFFSRVAGFHILRTDAADLQSELTEYVRSLMALGGPDIFFVGHGPEPGDASHFAYVRPGSGATAEDLAGIIPVAPALVDHHISKFRAGGITVPPEDERQARLASSILTFGPAMLLSSVRVVQSIVDADTAPAKRSSFQRVLAAHIPADKTEALRMLDENPGLWVRMHGNVRSLTLPNLYE